MGHELQPRHQGKGREHAACFQARRGTRSPKYRAMHEVVCGSRRLGSGTGDAMGKCIRGVPRGCDHARYRCTVRSAASKWTNCARIWSKDGPLRGARLGVDSKIEGGRWDESTKGQIIERNMALSWNTSEGVKLREIQSMPRPTIGN